MRLYSYSSTPTILTSPYSSSQAKQISAISFRRLAGRR